MSWPIGTAILVVLMFAGMPISFALALVGTVGVISIISFEPAFSLLGQTFFDNSRNYSLSVLPLFLMMGNFVVQSGIAEDLYKAANAWLRHRKGLRGGHALQAVQAHRDQGIGVGHTKGPFC